jgi:hypothetical protein
LKPPYWFFADSIKNSKALGRANHTARNPQIQRSVDMHRLALVGFNLTKTNTFLSVRKLTNRAKLLHDAFAQAKGF